MPNGGEGHCGHCKHLTRNSICSIRKKKIFQTYWTRCHNWNNTKTQNVIGPIYAIVCEVLNGGGHYACIPYYKGNRVDTFQEGNGNTKVKFTHNKQVFEFNTLEKYMEFYNMETKKVPLLIGAVAGDVIGSVFEHRNIKTTEFRLFTNRSFFTDDTVMTIALADSILNNLPVTSAFQKYGQKYPNSGYGGNFIDWIFESDPQPYNSWGNGSAMRVSPVGFAYNSEKEVLEQAKRSAEVSHNHIEGIKGAQATAMCIFLARNGKSKKEIKDYVINKFSYDLSKSIDKIRPYYIFDVSCQGSVPQAITAFLESSDYESAIRLAISIGGDSDTIACITGGIAQAFYKDIPMYIVDKTLQILPNDFVKIITEFDLQFSNS